MLASLAGCHFLSICFIMHKLGSKKSKISLNGTYLCALYDSMSIGKGVNHLLQLAITLK